MEKCKKMSEKMILKTMRDNIRSMKKAGLNTESLSKKEQNALRQKLISMSTLTYCNPGCKGTMFSDDPQWFTHMKKEYQKKVNNKEMTAKDAKQVLSSIHDMRNNLVKGSKSTLLNKNSFYRNIKPFDLSFLTGKKTKKSMSPATYKKTMKSRGALSACSMAYF
jgi:hypothetical protein